MNSHEIHCKIRNCIYLITFKNCRVQYVAETITPVNLRMNIHQKGKSVCEHCVNHYKNVCKGASFSIQVFEKLDVDNLINGQRDFAAQKHHLQREDYWMRRLHTIYSYGLNKRDKNSHLEQPPEKLFPSFPRFGNRRENLEERGANEPTTFYTTETLLAHIAIFSPKNKSVDFRRIL